jgi:hypothetical protein
MPVEYSKGYKKAAKKRLLALLKDMSVKQIAQQVSNEWIAMWADSSTPQALPATAGIYTLEDAIDFPRLTTERSTLRNIIDGLDGLSVNDAVNYLIESVPNHIDPSQAMIDVQWDYENCSVHIKYREVETDVEWANRLKAHFDEEKRQEKEKEKRHKLFLALKKEFE